MRIFFTGSQATGKTTLVRIIAEKYKFQPIESVSQLFLEKNRKYTAEMFRNISSDLQYELYMFARDLYMKEDIVSARSFIDSYAYVTHLLEKLEQQPEENELKIKEMNKLLNIIKRDIYDYHTMIGDPFNNILFYTPIEFTLSDKQMRENSLRPVDEQFRREIDRRISRALRDFTPMFYKLTGDIPSRVRQISSYIDKQYYEKRIEILQSSKIDVNVEL